MDKHLLMMNLMTELLLQSQNTKSSMQLRVTHTAQHKNTTHVTLLCRPIWLQIFRTELTKQFYDKYMTESTTSLDILLLQSCFSIIFINILHDTSNLISEVILCDSLSEVSELHPFLMVLFFLLPKLSFLSACGMVWCPIYYLFCPRVCPIPPSSITSGPSPAPSFLPPLIFLQSTFLNKAAEKNSPRISLSGINHF